MLDLLLLLAPSAALASFPPSPPLFSWDTVPVFMHSGNGTGPLNAAAAAFMAKFSLVTMPGYEGNENCSTNFSCCNEGKIAQFARSVKAVNSTARVMYYQNGLINFPQTVLGRLTNSSIPESFLLHDNNGRLVYLGGCGSHHAAPNHTLYDHRQAAMREAWVENIVDVLRSNANGLIDGVFADRSGSIASLLTKDLSCYKFGHNFANEWDRGHWQAIANTQAALSALTPTAIVIGNHAEATAAMRLAEPNVSWSGKMFEHFTPVRPYIPAGNQLNALRADARYSGGLVVEAHVDFCSFNTTTGSAAELSMYRRSLAAFLIGAGPYAYYACTKGWGYHDGWNRWSADYDRPLGAPNGSAVKTKTGWRRSFASGTQVWLDTDDATDSLWGSSCIRWADGHVTKSGKLCAKEAFVTR